MIRDVTLGQYYPSNGFLHKLDPRVKVLSLAALIILIFCSFNFYALGIATFLALFTVILSKVPLNLYLKSMKAIIFVVILTSVLNIFYGSGEPIFQWWVFKITMEGIRNSIFVTVRIIDLVLLSSALTFTTTPTDLTDALERLMKPLGIFGIKVHEIAMMMTIALRFVPTLLEETDKIMSAQKARGADMESGNIVSRIKALIPILVPLFVSAFRRAYDLAMAMECRCYQGGKGRTRMKKLKLGSRDAVALAVLLIFTAGVVLCDIFL
ncbi:MAG: energy-coupling factor transporter transmembrane component T [Eubacteriales bacterium]|nr:energy-coupling factor transporter transmembrane component T [Eubacteriales bacterium]